MITDWIDIPYRPEPEHAGLRLDAFLSLRMKGRSRSVVARLIESGQVSLAGRAVKPATRIKAGETVFVRFPRREDPPARFDSLPILHEDEFLVAIDKPGRLLSHPTDKVRRDSATEILGRQLPKTPLHLVHRLDRETSGVLLFAKSPAAAKTLAEQFARREVKKEYLAVVSGEVAWEQKLVDAPLAWAGGEIKILQKIAPGGTPALTQFFRLAASGGRSLVRALPRTGRLHQIRAHLAWLGHPVVGDKLYQGRGEVFLKATRGEMTQDDLDALGAPRQLLHARRIAFRHPASGLPVRVTAPAPADFPEAFSEEAGT